jgi:hypothetical protein
MAKQGGMGQGLFVHGYHLSGDIQKLDDITCSSNLLPFTDITQYGQARELGERDAHLAATTYFDVAANASHPRLSVLPYTDVHLMYVMNSVLGGDAFAMIGKEVDYAGNRNQDGSFLFKVDAQSNGYAAEYVTMLTAGSITVTGAGSQTSVDTTASAAFGAQAYLQVFAFSGTDATVVVEDSASAGSGFAAVTGLTFTALSAGRTAERKATTNTATVRRYLRATVTTSAGFTSLAFAVGVDKNATAGVLF